MFSFLQSRMRSPKLFRTAEEHESEVGAKLSKHSDIITSCEEIVMIVHPDKGMSEYNLTYI